MRSRSGYPPAVGRVSFRFLVSRACTRSHSTRLISPGWAFGTCVCTGPPRPAFQMHALVRRFLGVIGAADAVVPVDEHPPRTAGRLWVRRAVARQPFPGGALERAAALACILEHVPERDVEPLGQPENRVALLRE